MHGSKFPRTRVPNENRKCWSLRSPKLINSWLWNPISYEDKRFNHLCCNWCSGIQDWKGYYTKTKDFRWAWKVPDKRRPNVQRLLVTGQSSDWSTQCITWHWPNGCFSVHYSNIMSNNYFNMSGLRQQVPEAHLLNNWLKWRLLPKKMLMGDGVVNMIVGQCVELQVRLSEAENAANTWSIADTDRIVSQLVREIYGIASNEQIRLKQGILHLFDRIWTLMFSNQHSGAPEDHQTVCNPFRISQDASFEPYMTVNIWNGFWQQFHHPYFWMATYHQCERGTSINLQSQLHPTDAQAQCPV